MTDPSVPRSRYNGDRETEIPRGGRTSGSGCRPGRQWLFRALALLLPVLALVIFELALLLAGYGHPTGFLLKTEIEGQPVFIENAAFGRLFFPEHLVRKPLPLVVSQEKPPGTFRIVVFGESAAQGHPAPAFGFPRFLSTLLRDRYPDPPFEVVNTGMTAINSHAIRLIARDCAKLRGDVWIVYMGNNEVIGPFGPATVLGSRAPDQLILRSQLAVKSTRIGQLLEGFAGRLFAKGGSPSSWQGLERFARQQVRWNDPRMAGVYSQFGSNLGDILDAGTDAGARVLLCTVAGNLKHCAPFASLHRADLASTQLAEWDSIYREGIAHEAAGRWAEALSRYEAAAQVDGEFAELHYRWGRCGLALGNAEDARAHFERARDLDALRFRTDGRLNDLIRQAATARTNRGVRLLDTEPLLNSQSADGIPGEELFYEHVHFNFAGNYWLARAIAASLTNWLPGETSGTNQPRGWLTLEECTGRLGLTEWNRRQIEGRMRRWLQGPPFTNQCDHLERDRRYEARLAGSTSLSESEALAQAVESQRRAVHTSPADWVLRENLARVLEAADDIRGASEQWLWLSVALPHYVEPQLRLAAIADRLGRADQAKAHFRQALDLGADTNERAEAHNGIGLVLAHQGGHRAAVREFNAALKLQPNMVEARINLGLSLHALGDAPGAIQQHELALRERPASVAVHFNLGKMLQEQGRSDEARRHFAEVVRLDPQNREAALALTNLLPKVPGSN